MKHKYYLRHEQSDHTQEFQIERRGEHSIEITKPCGETMVVDLRAYDNIVSLLTEDGESIDIHVGSEKDDFYRATTPDETYRFSVLNERKMRMMEASGGHNKVGGPELVCPMAGKVVLVKVEVGQEVEEGEVVVIVEAMKMENDLKAHISGKISEICVTPGETIEIGTVLVKIESLEAE